MHKKRRRCCRTEERHGRDDSVAHRNQDGNSGLEVRDGEVDDIGAIRRDLQRRDGHVRIAVENALYQAVPPTLLLRRNIAQPESVSD